MSSWVPSGGERGPTPIGHSLDRVTKSLGLPKVDALGAVFGRWSQLVGEQVAAHSRPTKFRGGVLTVTVDEPVWATQLRWLEHDLLQRLAEGLGEGAVTSIEVRVARP